MPKNVTIVPKTSLFHRKWEYKFSIFDKSPESFKLYIQLFKQWQLDNVRLSMRVEYCGEFYDEHAMYYDTMPSFYIGFTCYINDMEILKTLTKKFSDIDIKRAVIVSNPKSTIIQKQPVYKFLLIFKAGDIEMQDRLLRYIENNKDALWIHGNAKALLNYRAWLWGGTQVTIGTNDLETQTMIRLLGYEVELKRVISEEEALKEVENRK